MKAQSRRHKSRRAWTHVHYPILLQVLPAVSLPVLLPIVILPL